ncbi:MAG: gliding motility-associated C-terminal domain-containing protein [Prolixibacteraceae bacterium]
MFLKRLSTALLAYLCFGGFALGANPETLPNANQTMEENFLAAPLDVVFTLTPHSPRCTGESNGSIDVQIGLGFTAPFSYQLQFNGGAMQPSVSGLAQTFSIPDLKAGTYTINITDGSGTTGSSSIPINDLPLLDVYLESPVVQPACAGGTSDLLFEANGGDNAGYTYQLFNNGISDGSNSTGDFLNKGQGAYSLIVSDASGCQKNYSSTIQISVPSLINFSFNIIQAISCDDGFASVDFNNLPADPFTIVVHNNDLNKDYTAHDASYVFSNLEAGNYDVTVTRNSCPTDVQTASFTIDPFNAVSLTTNPASPVTLDCGGITDLRDVDVTINGGKVGLKVRLVLDNNNGISDDDEATIDYGSSTTFQNVKGGNYTIRWNDVSNPSCNGTIPYVINSPASVLAFTGEIVGLPVSCNAGSNGAIQVPVAGGTLPYTYYIDNIDKGNDAAAISLSAGSYEVKVVDANGCFTENKSVSITEPQVLIATHNLISDSNVTCPGGNDGEISLTVSGGNGGYTYDLSGDLNRTSQNASANFNITALVAGTYSVLVKDSKGCSAPVLSNMVITQPNEISISNFALSSTKLCYGATADLNVAASGGSQTDYTYELFKAGNRIGIQTSSGAVNFSGLNSSNYLLVITNDPACSSKDIPFTIEAASQITVNNFADSVSVNCANDLATINLNITGTTPLQYSLDGGALQGFTGGASSGLTTITGLTGAFLGQTHDIIIQDDFGCTKNISLSVYEPSALINTAPVIKDVVCKGSASGIVSVQVSGGSPGYSATLGTKVQSSNNGSIQFNNVLAGNYSLQITDNNGCSLASPIDIVVKEPAENLAIETNLLADIKCFGEQAEVEIIATGGWNVSKTITVIGQSFNESKPSGSSFFLKAGDYSITASNSDNCSITQNYTVSEPAALKISNLLATNISCFNEDDATLTFSISGGTTAYTYGLKGIGSATTNVSGNSVAISGGLVAGDYNVIAKDNNGCTSNIIPVTITEPAEVLVALLTPSPKVSCTGLDDAVVSLQVTGGSSSFSVEVLGSGKPAKVTNASGIVTFNLAAGVDYDVLVTDVNTTCVNTFTDLFSVQAPPTKFAIADIAITQANLSCFGDSTRLEVILEGGWGGDYLVNIQGAGLNLNLPASNVAYLKAGTYNFTATDLDYGCISTQNNVAITQPNKLVLSVLNSHNVSCYGAEDANIAIGVTGGVMPYYWGVNGVATIDAPHEFNSNTLTLNNSLVSLPQGTYDVIVQDGNGCPSNIKPVSILEPNPITFEYAMDTFVTCFGKSDATITLLNVSGGSNKGFQTYLSTGGAETLGSLVIDGLGAETYSLRVVDGSGVCSSEPVSIEIKEPSNIVLLPGSFEIDNIKCYGVNEGRIKLAAQGGIPYDLEYKITGKAYQSSSEFKDLGAGLYNVFVRNTKGNCETTIANVEVTTPDKLKFDTFKITKVSCFNSKNGQVEINVVGGTGNPIYYLAGPATSSSNNSGVFSGLGEKNLKFSTYSVQVKDENQCQLDSTFTLQNPDELVLEFLDKTHMLCNNQKDGTIRLRISGGTINTSSDYKFKDILNTSLNYVYVNDPENEFLFTGLGSASASTYYQTVVTDNNLCTDTLTSAIEIKNPVKVSIPLVDWGEKLCFGDTDDKTIVHAIGGTNHFYYSMDNGVTYSALQDSIFVGLTAGVQRPYVKDENNCDASYTEYNFPEPSAVTVEYEFFPIRCYNDEFGNLELDIVGGTGNYYLSVNDPEFGVETASINRASTDTTTFNLLDNGIELSDNIKYKFYLRDENLCRVQNIAGVNSYRDAIAENSFRIPEKLVLVDLTQQGVDCRNERTGKIEFEADGGTISPASGYILTAVNEERGGSKVNENGKFFVDNLFAGRYQCTLTDANGCIGETSLSPLFSYDTISVAYRNDSINLTINEISLPTCDRTYDGSLKINISDYQFAGATVYVDYLESALDEFIQFDDPDSIAADEDYKRTITDDYVLYYATSQLVAEYMGIGRYVITVVDNYTGCEAEIDTTIGSTDGDICPPEKYFNVFSPHNGDDINDDWIIHGSQHQKYDLKVFTAWGELVYSDKGTAGNEGVKWNGVDNKNRPVPVGTYIYLLHKNEGSAKDTLINGNITIIRADGRW